MHAAWGDASSGDLRPAGRGDPGEALLSWADQALRSDRALRSDQMPHLRWMAQVHGAKVLVTGVAGDAAGLARPTGRPVGRGTPVACSGLGDALVSTTPELALAVLTADCASIALGSSEGVFAAVHAGWRGLVAGVVGRAVATMRELGATEVVGALGPCIHGECYEFSEADLAEVAARCGEGVRGRTSDGRPALDLPAAVAASLAACGVGLVPGRDACTACDPGYYSHRARGDRGRQALLVWSDQTAS